MYCLKCGKSTQDNQVFCDSCLQSMEKYPVKPGTAIHLPHRNTPAPVKKQSHRKRVLTPEEQILRLKTASRRLTFLAVLLAICLCLCGGMLIYQLTHQDIPVTGRNYTIDTNQQP